MSSFDELPSAFRRTLSDEDIDHNSTLQSFSRIRGQLEQLERWGAEIDAILDVGCGRGGFVTALGEHLDAETVYGIDVRDKALKVAESSGVTTFSLDVETEPFPLDTKSVDLVVSFGLLEHLCYYDHFFQEANRVLRDGLLWVATPNLGGWNNRLALLTGHQPRNVELSRERAVGTLPVYDPEEFLDHVHAPTYGALLRLLEFHGFDPIDGVGLRPYQRSNLVKALDVVFGLRTTWARRVAVLSSKQ